MVHVPIIPKLEEPRDLPRAIPDDDLAAILKAAVPHLRDIVTVCVHTGMRQREVLTLRKDQVSLADRVIYLDSSTTGKRGRAAYINKVVYQILRRWLDLDPMAKQVFTYRPKVKGANGKRTEALPRPWGSLKKAWEGALKRAGLSGRYRFHDLRVTRGTALHRLGVGPIDIQHMLGHSSITTTLRYVQASNDRQRAAVEALAQNSRTTKVPHESLTRPKRRTLANGLTH